MVILSCLGETGLNVIYPADCQNEVQAIGDMALLGHEAELHYHSLEPMASQNLQLAIAKELKHKFGQGKIPEEVRPKCGIRVLHTRYFTERWSVAGLLR